MENTTGRQAGIDTGEAGEREKIMDTYYMRIGAKIDENLEIVPASSYYPGEGSRDEFFAGLERMDAGDLIAYAEAVPTWDYVEDGMWEYIAYWLNLDLSDYVWGDNGCFDPDAFLTDAKTALKARESC